MKRALRAMAIRAFLLSMVFAVQAFAQSTGSVSLQIIDGSPLNIHVGSDGAFQIFNDDVPGSGQIYPSGCARVADMGVFADVDGILYAPNFSAHGCGTATGGIGTYTPWVTTSFEQYTGAGTVESPYTLVVGLSSGALRINMTVKYVNGDNFFRVSKAVTSNSPANARIFFGADIYLASSDNGVAFLESGLRSPGGQDCATPPTYSILFIPVTPASAYSATQYAQVWSQIGAGQLNRQVGTAGCIDNGAALQWDRTIVPGETATINSAVSFGEVPDASNFAAFSLTPSPATSVINNGDTQQFVVTVRRNNLEFNSPVTIKIDELPAGLTASLDRTVLNAPGDGFVLLNVNAQNMTPELHTIAMSASGGGEFAYTTITLDVVCDPPFILGFNNNQPRSQSVPKGTRATLTVIPGGSGPRTFQWYQGPAGSTYFPISGATGATFLTPAVNDATSYWVRVTNNCGSVDSYGAVVQPSN